MTSPSTNTLHTRKQTRYRKRYKEEISFIENTFWKEMITLTPDDPTDPKSKKIIPQTGQFNLPFAYFAVNKGRWGDPKKHSSILFNWDNAFILPAIAKNQQYQKIAVGVLENFDYMFTTYGFFPNGSSLALAINSQPPLYTTMVLSVFDGLQQNNEVTTVGHAGDVVIAKNRYEWLSQKYQIAVQEHDTVWVSDDDFEPALGKFHHRVKGTLLSKYGDRDAGYAWNAERESGWDMTDRFGNRCNEFLPVDLNCYLFKYEKDLALMASLLAKRTINLKESESLLAQSVAWEKLAEKRKGEINTLMWDSEKGFFFDFDYYQGGMYKKNDSDYVKNIFELTPDEINKGRSDFYSLAGFMPLWAGLATPQQAAQVMQNLSRFTSAQGLCVSDKESMPKDMYDFSSIDPFYRRGMEESIEEKQWGYPNIFICLEKQVVEGLLTYGYTAEAKHIMQTALEAESRMFQKYKDPQTGKPHGFAEKRRADGMIPPTYHYAHQTEGFGWTCGVFVDFIEKLDKLVPR